LKRKLTEEIIVETEDGKLMEG